MKRLDACPWHMHRGITHCSFRIRTEGIYFHYWIHYPRDSDETSQTHLLKSGSGTQALIVAFLLDSGIFSGMMDAQ